MEQNRTYYVSKEEYLALKAHWSKNHWQHGAKDMVVYNVLRGKPARNGFVEKKRHLQGNDPWFAYKLACSNALNYTHDKWEHTGYYGGNYVLDKEAHKLEMKAKRNERFKELFGIELPEDLYSKLHAALEELKDEK